MKKHKTYNPFKMWLSYVGLIILPIITYFNSMNIYKLLADDCPNGMACMPNPFAWAMPYTWISIPVGFLLGWGIHSLIRKLTKGKI